MIVVDRGWFDDHRVRPEDVVWSPESMPPKAPRLGVVTSTLLELETVYDDDFQSRQRLVAGLASGLSWYIQNITADDCDLVVLVCALEDTLAHEVIRYVTLPEQCTFAPVFLVVDTTADVCASSGDVMQLGCAVTLVS